MIKSLTVENYQSESLTIDLFHPETSGFIITSITGIGAGEASINISEIATKDGGIFNSARKSTRNIVINLEFMDGKINDEILSIEDVRHRSYKYFPLKRKVVLTFTTDNREVNIEGYVENNEINIFEEREGCQISILCPFPWFKRRGLQRTYSDCHEAMFEFPFHNNLTYVSGTGWLEHTYTDLERPNYYIFERPQYNLRYSEGIVFGEIRKYGFPHEVFYEGSVEAGFEMEISFLDSLVDDLYGKTENKAGYLVIKDDRYSDKKMIINLDKIKELLPRCTSIIASLDPENPENPSESEDGGSGESWYLLHTSSVSTFWITRDFYRYVNAEDIFTTNISAFEKIKISFKARSEDNLKCTINMTLTGKDPDNGSEHRLIFFPSEPLEVSSHYDRTFEVELNTKDVLPYLTSYINSRIRFDLITFEAFPCWIYFSDFKLYGKADSRTRSMARSIATYASDEELSSIVPIAQKGDILRISTTSGKRGIWYQKPDYRHNSAYEGEGTSFMLWGEYKGNGIHYYKDDQFNILGALNKDAEWFMLSPGYNHLEIYHTFYPDKDEMVPEEEDLVHADYLEIGVVNDVLYEGV